MPRVRDVPGGRSRRRPHIDAAAQARSIICYCPECDKEVERGLSLRLSECCDCDQYTRWICISCKLKEDQEERSYLKTSTKDLWDVENPDGFRVLPDHQSDRVASPNYLFVAVGVRENMIYKPGSLRIGMKYHILIM
jgi:hypothetical protein